MARQRILRSTAATIQAFFRDQEGEATSPAADVTVTVVDSAGESVTSGTAAIDGDTPGRVTFALSPTQTAELDEFTATWEDDDGVTVETTVEIVGGYYFSVAEARASDDILKRTEKYTDEMVIAARAFVESECEVITGQAFVPRFKRVTFLSDGGYQLSLMENRLRRVRSLSVGGTAYSNSDVANLSGLDSGRLEWAYGGIYPIANGPSWNARPFGVPGSLVDVAYEHGWDAPPPDLKRMTLARVRQVLNMAFSGIPDRATTWSNESGATVGLALPGQRGAHIDGGIIDETYRHYTVSADATAYSVPIL